MDNFNNIKKLRIIISIIAISFIQGLQYSLSPVLGQISEYYRDISVSLVQMLITAPAVLGMLIALLSGVLVRNVSKKKLLIFSGFIAGLVGFIPFLYDNFYLLFISRIVFGLALGLATTLNTAVVADFFEGEERVAVMGIQASSIGVGMVLITMLGGYFGKFDFTYAYYIHIVGFIAMILIGFFLPDKGLEYGKKTEIKLNKRVFELSFLGFLEFLFLITFTTNISMHLAGSLVGNSQISGILTAVFSCSQILVGIFLAKISKLFASFTLTSAMLSFVCGGILLVLFPDKLFFLILSAIFCGFSQGVFIPTAMVETTNAVDFNSTAMASAFFVCAISLGQLVSPTLINFFATNIFGSLNTTNVYKMASMGMAFSAVLSIFLSKTYKNKEK